MLSILASFKGFLIVGAVASTIAFASGYKLRDYQADGERVKLLEAHNKAKRELEQQLNKKTRERHRIGIELQKAKRELNKKPELTIREVIKREAGTYNNCVLPDDGVRVINEAITASGLLQGNFTPRKRH